MKTNVPVFPFNGGEVDKYTLGRTDLDVAPHTAEVMENVTLTLQGAMELAPGSLFIGETPGSVQVWLRPWLFDEVSRYALELSAGLVRFIFGEGYQTITGTAATLGSFTDESAPPSSGGGAPPGTGSIMVSVAGGGAWLGPFDGNYFSGAELTISGGNGDYVNVVLNFVSGDLFLSSREGTSIEIESPSGLPSSYTITVTDSIGNSGTSSPASTIS